MIIKVLGPGCHNCHTLEKNVRAALAGLGIEAPIESVTDYGEIAGYGVLRTRGSSSTRRSSCRGACRSPMRSPDCSPPAPDGAGPDGAGIAAHPAPGPPVLR
ncbi:hypothetical protein GCM10023153_29590 [Ornithinibacter aureus]|uniref:Thioredoxin-like fold domain-containing protein n=1 Tax=Ornithinibacter aureus TaxID=622664 RepID=A0ABP8K7E8_9MICO|nr:thioredoxin family protein [Ornithinibacter aureus]KAF0834903.1 thioredoxin-like protein [Ornithinibacter aureus]